MIGRGNIVSEEIGVSSLRGAAIAAIVREDVRCDLASLRL